MAKVSVIILNYNGREFLAPCLDSVLKQSYADFEVIFVDNGSSDGSYEFVKENLRSPLIRCFRLSENIGFTGGNNYGLRQCKGELIVMLNNDVVVDRDWLRNLVELISSDENIGIVQSLVITEGVDRKYYERNGTINLLGHNIMRVFEIGSDGIGEIFQATGCSLIIRNKTIQELGGLFPDEYFMYAEDSYLSFGVKFAGYRILHTSRSLVRHKGGVAAKTFEKRILTFYQERNRLLNFLIYFPSSFRWKYYFIMFVNFPLKLFLSLLFRKYSWRGVVRAYLWIFSHQGWIDEQRRSVLKPRKVGCDEVLRYLSGKIMNGENSFERLLNFLPLLYCRIMRIKVLELQ